MSEKTGFILHYDMLENIKLLGNDVTVEILTALANYDRGLEVGKLSPQAQFAFNAYLPSLQKAKKRWEASVKNGCQHKPSDNLPEPSDNLNQSYSENQEGVTVTVTDTVPVNVNDNVSGVVSPKQQTNTNVDIILNACKKIGYSLDEKKAEEILNSGTNPSWFVEPFSYPDYIAGIIDESYADRPPEQKRRLFRTILADPERLSDFPNWKGGKEAEAAAQKERLKQESIANEKRKRVDQAKANKPKACGHCGAAISPEKEHGTCTACGWVFCFDEKSEGYAFYEPVNLAASFESLIKSRGKEQAARAESA